MSPSVGDLGGGQGDGVQFDGPRFGVRLAAAMDDHGPLCVGLDPHPALLAQWGLSDDVVGLRSFALTVVDALVGRVAAIKPQSAFFERHGSAGIAVLEEVLALVRGSAGGTQVILDAKRGDIGSTMAGYADAYLRDGAPLACDALTVTPYLGFGSLAPALDAADATGRGLFVLALTSNPEGPTIQHAQTPTPSPDPTPTPDPNPSPREDFWPQNSGVSGREVLSRGAGTREGAGAGTRAGAWAGTRAGARTRAVARVVAEEAGERNRQELSVHDGALGSVGLVVGATVGDAVSHLGIDLEAVRGPLLAPGVGAQGAGPAELTQVFGGARRSVLASTSRGVLSAGPDPSALLRAARSAAAQAAQALR